MMLRALGTLLVGSLLMGAAEPASTCLFAPTELHRIDADLRGSDTAAPGTPVIVEVEAFRRNGTTCTHANCVTNSCGDTGTVRIDLAPAADDGTPPDQLGYRLTLLRGELPDSMRSLVGVNLAGGRPFYLRPSFDELPLLNLTFTAVAVDAAGNESAPTVPFEVDFEGCTLAAVGDRCEDELDPETDLSEEFNGGLAAMDAASSVRSGVSCSFGATGSAGPALPTALALALLLLGRMRRSR